MAFAVVPAPMAPVASEPVPPVVSAIVEPAGISRVVVIQDLIGAILGDPAVVHCVLQLAFQSLPANVGKRLFDSVLDVPAVNVELLADAVREFVDVPGAVGP